MNQLCEIKLICTECTRSDYYYELIVAAADKLGLHYTLEKITDEAQMEQYGLSVRCLLAYCPGCEALNQAGFRNNSEMWVPAMVINGHIAAHSRVPQKEEFEVILSTCC